MTNPVEVMLANVFGKLKAIEPLQNEKRIQSVAENLLIALTRSVGLVYTKDEKQLKATVSMCIVVAEEFVMQVNSRFDKVRATAEENMKKEMQDAHDAMKAEQETGKQDEPSTTEPTTGE